MSYCNRCGAKLKPVSEEMAVVSAAPPVRVSAGAAWAMAAAVAFITLGGFALIFSLVMVFVSRGLSIDEGRLVVIILALLVIMLVDWQLLRQFTRLTSGKSQAGDDAPAKPEKRKPAEKPSAVPPQLAAPREPVTSVTEHTTRTFEPVYRDRETRP